MSWMLQNRWYLVALAVIAPLAVLVALGAGWFAYAEAESGRPIPVGENETVAFAGAEWTVTDAGSIASDTSAGESIGLLPGTSLVIVTLEVSPGEEPPDCTLELTDASGARQWHPATYSDVDVEADENAETYCSTTAEGPYTLQSWFVVPEDAASGARLRLTNGDAEPEFLLFTL